MSLSATPDPANHPSIFNLALADRDQQVAASLTRELGRQRQEIELIASENIVSRAVLEAQGSIMTNKYAEGYPGRRYYGGCQYVDEVETLAIERVKALFGCNYANVQPSSGSQANQAAFLATMRPGDCFMGLSLDQGGHLTHGARPNLSGKWFQPVFYGLDQKTGLIDYDALGEIAEKAKPAVIIAGGSGYSRTIDFAAFAKVAEAVGAYLMVDMAHIAGLIAGGAHPSPFPHAHIVTSTTHKTLRGPRGGLILSNDEQIARKIDSAVFPGLQGGPLMHAIAAKAVAFGEAQSDEFRSYSRQVVENASALAGILSEGGSDIGVSIVSGGTDNHLMLVDLSESGLTGKEVEAALGRANITCNKNGVPGDKRNPTVTSGVRLGTPAVTSRGFGVSECQEVGRMILKIVNALARQASDEERTRIEQEVKDQALKLTGCFPIY